MEVTEDKKKRLKILGIVGGVAMAGLVALNFVGSGNKEDDEENKGGNVYAEIVDPETGELNGQKIDGAGTRDEKITGWWDDLGEVQGDEGGSSQSSEGEVVATEDFIGQGKTASGGRVTDDQARDALGMGNSGGSLTAEELRAILEESNRGNGGGGYSGSSYSSGGTSSSGGSYSSGTSSSSSTRRTQSYEDPSYTASHESYDTPASAQSQSSTSAASSSSEPEEDRITIATTEIRKSSPISSFDDDWSTAGSDAGVSSFGGNSDKVSQDERHPFKCMFMKDEKLANGQRVTLRLLEDIVVNGVVITANSHLTAVCSINDRLNLTVTSYERNNAIYSLNYDAYDTDGLKGIYCPSLSKAKDQVVNDAGNMANTYAGTKMGRLAQDIVNSTISIFRSAKGEVTVCVPQGYTFYIVKHKER